MTHEILIPNQKAPIEYLDDRHFASILFIVLTFHLLAGYGWSILPSAKVIDIPVRMLNIRLGDADLQEQEEAIKPPQLTDNTKQIYDDSAKPVRPDIPKPTLPKPAKKPLSEPVAKPISAPPKLQPINNKIESPRQFVREIAKDNIAKNNGSALGNSTASNAEIEAAYGQTASLWINKFKLYPDEARAKNLQGNAVVRVRIDRRGNIRYTVLESSSGYEELDRAALDMVRRANPAPALPDGYPKGELFDFLVPVSFHFE